MKNQLKHQAQLKRIKSLLNRNGQVSRNEALKMGITRLSAIIFKLKEQGLDIQGRRRPNSDGKSYDYVYKQKAQRNCECDYPLIRSEYCGICQEDLD